MKEADIFDYSLRPGQNLQNDFIKEDIEIKVSIVTPYYNAKKDFEETYNSVINQTFSYFEWIIVNDGSTEEDTEKFLENLAKKDKRIKVHHKQNEGPAIARDYGIERAKSEYVYMLDADDLLDPTIVETLYFSMKTNPDYSMAYTNLVSFSDTKKEFNYLHKRNFEPQTQLKENLICGNIMLKKQNIIKSGNYSQAERGVHEDWHLWQRMLRDGNKVLHLDFYGFWYRRQNGVLQSIVSDKKKNEHANQVINKISKQIKKEIGFINFPSKHIFNYDEQPVKFNEDIKVNKKYKDNKTIMLILPWLRTGGADRFYVNLIKDLKKQNYNVIVITTEACDYQLRQEVTYDCEYFDLTTFLNMKDWALFIDYTIKAKDVDLVFLSNSYYAYYVMPWLKSNHQDVIFVDYLHVAVKEWRNGGYGRDSAAISHLLDTTYTCTNFLKNEMKEVYNTKVRDVDCAYIGVDIDMFNVDNIVYDKKPFEAYQGRPTILFLCRLEEEKRPLLSLAIIKKLKEKIPNIMLYVVGDGSFRKKMEAYVNDNKLNDNVHFWGEVLYQDTVKFYVESDVLLINSFTEGLTLTAYESLSIGKPVVSSDVGGQKELINSKNGRIIPLLQDPIEDFGNYNYSEEEIGLYCDAFTDIFNDLDTYKKNSRKTVIKDFNSKNLMTDLVNKLKKLLKEGTKVKNTVDNINFYENYLVQYLEYRKDLSNRRQVTFKSLIASKFVDRLWNYRGYRFAVNSYKKLRNLIKK